MIKTVKLCFGLLGMLMLPLVGHADLTMSTLKEKRVIELLDRDTQRSRDQWQAFVMYVAGVRDAYQLALYDRVFGITGFDDQMGLMNQAGQCTQVDAEVLLIRALAEANRQPSSVPPSTPVAKWISDWLNQNCARLLDVIN